MTIRHLSQSITGLLRNNPVGTLDFLLDDKGNPLSDAEARIRLNEMLEQGQKYLPTSDNCVGFDPLKGCPGHEPLAGSDLTRAMLKRGDKIVTCAVSDSSEEDALIDGYYEVIYGIGDQDMLLAYGRRWRHAIPVNNQGKPLTDKEAGF